MASVIRGSDNFDSAAGAAMKAWVNFNGTGTVAIRASYNVSSITDNGTGDYTVNFTTALPDSNYTFLGTGGIQPGVARASIELAFTSSATAALLMTTTQVRFYTRNIQLDTQTDCGVANVAIFR